ncbi:MAG TPA: glycosyltransferase family 4 protein [Candidatus Binatia bacterium]|nr:glycosyltransferase family 4 protein [Candidatus Binatia bacterium]
MEDARARLNRQPVARGSEAGLNILAVAHLPFYRNGVRAIDMGGGAIVHAELFPRLARLGHTVRVIAEAPPARVGQERTGLSWDIPNLTVEWFAFEYCSGATPPPPSYAEVTKNRIKPLFDRLVREEKPDVVIIGRETLVWHVPDLCQEHRLPSLLIAHGSPTSGLVHGIYPEAVTRELVRRFQRIDAIVAVGKHLAEILRSLGLTQVCTIPNVADPVRFCPAPKDRGLLAELRIAPDHVVVGHLSSLKRGKRPFDIIDSAELVLRSNPQVVYLIIGDGPCRKEMEELGRRKGIAAGFRYVGEIDRQQVPRYLNLSDIVLLSSEREGLSLVGCEAQACGRTLLMSDIPAAYETIIDGETGVLYRLGDVHDLAAKTLALVRDPRRRHRIGEKARAAAARQTPERWVHRYEEVLRRTALRLSPAAGES